MEATKQTTIQPMPGLDQPKQSARRVARKSADQAQTGQPDRRRKRLLPAVAILCLIGGIVIGSLLTRARYHSGEVVATVNGVEINQGTFYHALESKDGAAIIRALVGEELRYQFAKRIGVAPSDAAIDAKLAEVVKVQPGIAQALSEGRISESDLKQTLRDQMVQDAVLTNGMQVSDAEIRSFYEHNIDTKNPQALFYTPETAQVEVIITRTKERAMKALQALTNNVTWEIAAGDFSEDQSRLSGGMLPPIQRGRTVSKNVPGLEDAIFSLKIGEQTGPKQFSGLWWIIRCVDKRPGSIQPFDKVKEQCELGVKYSHLPTTSHKQIEQEFADFQRKAKVQAFWAQYRQAVNLK